MARLLQTIHERVLIRSLILARLVPQTTWPEEFASCGNLRNGRWPAAGHLPSVLLSHEIYVTASVLGACTYVGLNGLGVDRLAAMTASFAVTFGVRGLAIRFGLSLPVFRESSTHERWTSKPKGSGETRS